METRFIWTPINNSTANMTEDEIEYDIDFEVSELRENPDYIQYYINWTRLITTGLIPMGALIYFNFGIFRGIQVSFKKILEMHYNNTVVALLNFKIRL